MWNKLQCDVCDAHNSLKPRSVYLAGSLEHRSVCLTDSELSKGFSELSQGMLHCKSLG